MVSLARIDLVSLAGTDIESVAKTGTGTGTSGIVPDF
jgi:hypothetical protein